MSCLSLSQAYLLLRFLPPCLCLASKTNMQSNMAIVQQGLLSSGIQPSWPSSITVPDSMGASDQANGQSPDPNAAASNSYQLQHGGGASPALVARTPDTVMTGDKQRKRAATFPRHYNRRWSGLTRKCASRCSRISSIWLA